MINSTTKTGAISKAVSRLAIHRRRHPESALPSSRYTEMVMLDIGRQTIRLNLEATT